MTVDVDHGRLGGIRQGLGGVGGGLGGWCFGADVLVRTRVAVMDDR